MSEYTKGKLSAGFGSQIVDQNGDFIALCAGEGSSFCAETNMANAAELVKRWNCHDALLEACEGLMKKADNGSADFDDPEPGSIYLKAKAALAAAKNLEK